MRAIDSVCDARGVGWSDTPSLHRRFVYNGWLLLLELDWRDLTGGAGGAPDGQPDKTVLKRYVWGLDLSQSLHAAGGIGGLLGCVDTAGTSSTADDRTFIYAYDGRGNVTQLIETTVDPLTNTPGPNYGTVAASYAYDAFGNITSQSGSYADANPFRFSTKYFDAETGLSYYGYRSGSTRDGRGPVGYNATMRVLIATMQYGRGYSQGTERYISMLSAGLRARGDEVVVLAGDPEGRGPVLPMGAVVDGDASLRAHPVGGPLEVRGLPPASYDALLDELRPDVVLMCCPAHIGVGVLAAARQRKIATTLAVHDYWWTCPKHGLDHWTGRICGGDVPWRECVRCMSHQHPSTTVRSLSRSSMGSIALPLLFEVNWRRKGLSAAKLRDWRGRREILKSELRACDAVIFPSRMAQRVLAGWAEPAREHWIPNGIEPHWFERPQPARTPAEGVPVAPETLTIGLAGALVRHKGPHVLFAALRRLGWRKTRVLVAGRGTGDAYERDLRESAAGLNVEFLGPVKSADMPAFFDALDVLVAPSLCAENHPIVILEATARGTAVIGSNHGGVAELLDLRNQFRAGDADALAERLQAWVGGAREAHPPPVISAEEMVGRTRGVLAAIAPHSPEHATN